MKKLLISFTLALIVFGSIGFYAALKYRSQIRQQRQNAKAPEQPITIIEGWSSQDIADFLEKNKITSKTAFINSEKSFNIAEFPVLQSIPKNKDLEGFLFPDTYLIPKNPLPNQDINEIIIQKTLENFSKKVSLQMVNDAAVRGMSLFNIITLASIIEKEANGSDNDKKIISGIFYNRLNSGMPLQSDATVNFITKKTKPSASLDDIQTDSPYNTYKYTGLPPGPICNPGLSSILAAIYPQNTEYFYFLTDPKTGNAIFAKTFDEQIKNKQKYLK